LLLVATISELTPDALYSTGSGELDKAEFDAFFASHLSPLDVKEEVALLFEMIEKFEDDGTRETNTITGPELQAYLQGWWRGSVEQPTGETLPPVRIPPKCVQLDGTDNPGTVPSGVHNGGDGLPLRGVIVEECHVSCKTDRDILLGLGRPVIIDDTPAAGTPEVKQSSVCRAVLSRAVRGAVAATTTATLNLLHVLVGQQMSEKDVSELVKMVQATDSDGDGIVAAVRSLLPASTCVD
jgi:hypothetical protein